MRNYDNIDKSNHGIKSFKSLQQIANNLSPDAKKRINMQV